MARLLPWEYPKDKLPSRWTLRRWRDVANKLARARGAKRACSICKRPINQWGMLRIKHPRTYGKSRYRTLCSSCATVINTMLDVLEWYGASQNMPAETWRPRPSPEEVAEMLASEPDQG